jgi:hypothetical protein
VPGHKLIPGLIKPGIFTGSGARPDKRLESLMQYMGSYKAKAILAA